MKNGDVILVITLMLFLNSLLAQNQQKRYPPLEEFTIANISYTNYGDSEFVKEGQTGKVNFSEIRVGFVLPKILENKKTILINGFEFTSLKPMFSEVENTHSITRNFYSFGYRFAILNPIGKKGWNYSVGLKPTLASDFDEKISSEDFILQASVLFSKRSNEFFKYGFGISFNTRFGKEQVLPVIQLVYKKNNWGTYAYLPAFVGSFYHFKSSKIGLSINLNGNSYNYRNMGDTGLDLDKLSFSRINFGPEYEFSLMNSLKINVNGGITVSNKLDWLNSNDKSELDLSPKSKPFIKIGLKFLK